MGPSCSESELRQYEIFLEGIAADGLNLVCGDTSEESDVCDRIIGQTPVLKGPPAAKSFVTAVVALFDSLGD